MLLVFLNFAYLEIVFISLNRIYDTVLEFFMLRHSEYK